MKNKVLIGIVGHALSGKDTVADFIAEKYSFNVISLGSLIRKYIKETKLGEPTRELMIATGNDLREKFGGDYLVLEALKSNKDQLVINGIRTVPELKTFKQDGGVLIACLSSTEDRFERAKKRGRHSDVGLSFEDFLAHELLEAENEKLHHQNIDLVIKEADYFIDNSGDLNNLFAQVNEIVIPLLQKNQ